MTGMAKYIDREALVEWLKRIPLKDLSDGRGLCRVIFEDDFKRAIKKIPKGIIVDVAPVRCRDCRKFKTYDCRMVASGYEDFCSYGERKEGDD